MLDQQERRQFVSENRLCVWGYNRREHGPAMTLGYYVMRDGEICHISMMARAKTKVALRDPRASVCVMDGKSPPSYVQVYGTVRVERDVNVVYDTFREIYEAEVTLEGNKFSEEEWDAKRDAMIGFLEDEDRIVLCLTPESTFYSPPTRGKTIDQKLEFRRSLGSVEEGSLRVGNSMPW